MDNADKFTFGIVSLIFIISILAFWDFAGVIIVAGSLAVVLMPGQRYLRNYMKQGFASLIITVIVGFLIIMAFYIILVVLYENADYMFGLVNSITTWINLTFFSSVSAFMGTPSDLFSDLFADLTESFKSMVLEFLSTLPLMAIKIMILFLSLFLFLVFGDEMSGQVRGIIPEKSRDDMLILKKSVTDMLYAIFNVHVAVAVAVFILAFPVFYILGYEHILFYAILSGILALIPVFGPVFLIAFLILYTVSVSDWRGLLIVLLLAWPLLCAIPDWWMRPVLMGRRASVNPVLMFIAFFGGIAVMGLLGFIMGPVFIALLIAGYRIIVKNSAAGG